MDHYVKRIIADYEALLEENSLDNKNARELKQKYERLIKEEEQKEKKRITEQRFKLSAIVYRGSFGFGPTWVEIPFGWVLDERDRLKEIKTFENKYKVKVEDLKPLQEYYNRLWD